MEALIKVEYLTKKFPLDKHSAIWAVNNVSFSIGRGETLGLVGESGSGKTTVGRCLLRLVEPDSGKIYWDGKDITRLSFSELKPFRHRISIIFQEPYSSLNPKRSVQQTVEEPLILQGINDEKERIERVRSTLIDVQLGEDYLSRFPFQMTASEQQRLGIARAIVTRPDLVVVDEATSNLDTLARAEILDLFIKLQKEHNVSYLFISHDLTAVEKVCHRISIMYLGRIIETAPASEIFNKQLHPYSKALLSAVLFPDPTRKLEPFMLRGEIPSAINPKNECSLINRCPFAQSRCKEKFPDLIEIEKNHFTACYRSDEFIGSGVPAMEQLPSISSLD